MRARSIGAVVVVLTALAAPPEARAQEVQVALDEAGQLDEIDRGLAERLGLFLDDYPDLQVVRLYRVDDEAFVLEITFRQDGRSARQRVPMTAGEVRALRGRVTAALADRAPRVAVDRDGRFLLLATTTALGLGYYGWAVPVMLDIDSGRGILAAYMFTAGASFVAPYLYTRNRPVTYGMANAGFWGSTRGISHGALLAHVLDSTPDSRMTHAFAMTGSLAEGLAGYSWARSTSMTAGDAHTIGNFGDFGYSWAGATMITLQPDSERLVYTALLGGAAAGLAVGPSRAERLPYTWGDAEVQRAAFYLGAANGLALWDLLVGSDPSDDQVRILGPLLLGGSVAGMMGADRALVGRDFSAGQGILVDLGTLAGGLLGVGLAVLLGPDDFDDPTGVFLLGALGADLGFLATFRSLSSEARRQNEGGESRIDIELNPGALGLLHPAGGLRSGTRVPLAAFRYRF